MVRDKLNWFSINNINFIEDTAFGQNTTHRILMVARQEHNTSVKMINPPLKSPKKSSSVELNVNYQAIHKMHPEAIWCDNVQIKQKLKSCP